MLEAVKVIGILVAGAVSIWTLRVSQKTHKDSNSRLTAMIEKADDLTARLATSKANKANAYAHQQPSTRREDQPSPRSKEGGA
jgi:hypothetical protein